MSIDYAFQSPWWLAALALFPLVWLVRRLRRQSVFVVPFAASWYSLDSKRKHRAWPVTLLLLSAALLPFGLGRLQRSRSFEETRKASFDIMIAIDLSRSMATKDFPTGSERVSRLAVAKRMVANFIRQRPYDRIGVVVFSGRSYTLSPPTWKHGWLMRQLERLEPGMIEDGTAIGNGLALAVEKLHEASKANPAAQREAFVVLLSDGRNNEGVVTPQEAAQLAGSRGISVYTVATAGDGEEDSTDTYSNGTMVRYTAKGMEVDERTLWSIAKVTGGQFFVARDAEKLSEAFEAIDQIKTKTLTRRVMAGHQELFPWFVVPSLLLAFTAVLFSRRTKAKSVPPGMALS
ncbi:MAG: VWA domain-containing protein [Opitutaceae bacterium]